MPVARHEHISLRVPATSGAFGVSAGDLAKKKIFPSLFALYHDGMLPKDFSIYGYARSKMSESEFRQSIEGNLPCRLADGAKCGETMTEFLNNCYYQQGQYASTEDFAALSERMQTIEKVCELCSCSKPFRCLTAQHI